MTSFELVNHQLKHMFGGIEAEKNSSLEYLENIQKKISKTMEKAQTSHMKIFQAVVTIKTSLTELSENYLSLSKESKHSSGLISKLTYEITDLLQDVSEESLSLSKKMESKVETYVPNLKKIKEKYTQTAETLEHYRKKVSLLKKNVEKQSLANIKQDEHERFERNKEKLRNAEKDYDQILIKTTKRFVEFNAEGMKDIENDLISVLTNIGGNVMQFCTNITKYLCQHFSAHEILLAKQLKLPKRGNQKIHSLQQQISTNKQSPEQTKAANYQNRKAFFEHLIEERQIQNYLKKIVDKQMVRKDGLSINQVFKPKKSIIVPPIQETPPSIPFTQFQNIYNNHGLKHHHHNLLQKLKEEDPIEACEDLLEIQQPTEISMGFEKQQISKGDLQISNPSSPQIQKHKDNDFQDRMKKNLQKFNKICHQNHIEREKSPLPNTKQIEKAISPSIKAIQAYKMQNNNYNSSKTVLKSPEQFFNLNYLETQKKEEAPKNSQEKLINLHEHPFNFALFEPEKKASFAKQPHNSKLPNNTSITSNNNNPIVKSASISIGQTSKPIIQHATVSFDNFDFLMKQHRTSELKPNYQPKPKVQTQISNLLILKDKKPAESNSMDLLEL